MVGVGIGRVVVMPVPMPVNVRVLMEGGNSFRLAGACAFEFTEGAAFRQTFHMVMMTFLNASDVLLETQHLGSVFAQ